MNEKLVFNNGKFYLGDKEFYMASGDMHYFRFFREGWERRLKLMADFGLTCVQTYVPWNLHEKEEGQYDFSGNLDLAEFIRVCGEYGLKVLLRPSPYICSEWDFGGLPYWLLKNPDVQLRCSDESYMKYAQKYIRRLCKEFVPLLSTNGGPVIAVAVENEYGSYGNDTDYLRKIADILKDEGVDVPLYTASGDNLKHLKWGSLPEFWSGIDSREGSEGAKKVIRSFQGDNKPFIVCEQWAGCAQQWGGVFNRQSVEEACRHYKNSLERGYYVNFYMFAGGTNFGFMNGGLYGGFRADVPRAKQRYIPYATSYDVDAPINEYGEPTPKYYALKKILCEYLGKEYIETEPVKCPTAAYGQVVLTQKAPLFENLDSVAEKTVLSKQTKTMEELSQDYGFILYKTHLDWTDDFERRVCIEGLHDRATIYVNREYVGSIYRDRESDVRFKIPEGGAELAILVENMGRICYSYKMGNDRKGILHGVHLDRLSQSGTVMHDFSFVMNFEISTLPLRDLSKIEYLKAPNENTPGFFKGTFKADSGHDTFVKINGGTKGNIWINSFNIGRYWSIGPQVTLYVPKELLKEENTIEVFELYSPKGELSAEFLDKPSLDSIKTNIETLIQAERA